MTALLGCIPDRRDTVQYSKAEDLCVISDDGLTRKTPAPMILLSSQALKICWTAIAPVL
jgi:hypothetical protein